MIDEWLVLLKQLLGIPEDDTSQDVLILFMADIALQAIQSRTGRQFKAGIYLDTFPGPLHKVYLNERPVIEVLEVGFPQGGIIADTDYRVDLTNGVIWFRFGCQCSDQFWGRGECCTSPLQVKYQANHVLPPSWLTMAVADAIRAAMATQTAGNQFGFMAKKVSVTDVGSVEFGSVSDSPAQAIGTIIDGALEGWIEPVMAFTHHCCSGPPTSEFLGESLEAA
jgi:hypothetical protein